MSNVKNFIRSSVQWKVPFVFKECDSSFNPVYPVFILQRKGGVDSDTDPNEPLRRDRSQFPVRKGQWG